MFRKFKNKWFPPLPRVEHMRWLVRRQLRHRVSTTLLSMALARGCDLIRHGLDPEAAAHRVTAWALQAKHPDWTA